ncbi:MAG TPA: hypothetical protein VHB18_06820 [Mycobacteriales bacterium]|nr:hypothetical protein [Mycobacteriales bacterium]
MLRATNVTPKNCWRISSGAADANMVSSAPRRGGPPMAARVAATNACQTEPTNA